MRAILLSSAALEWLLRLGGVGLLFLAIVANAAVPVPWGVEALTAVLAASHPGSWWYYAVMAAAGTCIGSYLTFRLSREGGDKALRANVPADELDRARGIFQRFGFWSIFVPALVPGMPMLPFVVTAGVMKYARHRFLLALGVGRLIRDGLVALVAAHYGRQILGFLGRLDRAMIAIAVVGAGVAAIVVARYVLRRKRVRAAAAGGRKQPKAA